MIAMSIQIFPSDFLLSGSHFSYLLSLDSSKRLLMRHYGSLLRSEKEFPSFPLFPLNPLGASLYLDKRNEVPDAMGYEFSLPFLGFNASPSLILEKEGEGSHLSFLYEGYEVREAKAIEDDLPSPHGKGEELIIDLLEKRLSIRLRLHYLLYEETDVLGRYIEIVNDDEGELIVHKASSLSLLLDNDDYLLSSFHGAWANELHEERRHLSLGTTLLYSDSGSSSNRIAPFYLLSKGEREGPAYGFSLLYSGSHRAEIDLDTAGRIHINQGISNLGFRKKLAKGERFLTPIVLLSYSPNGREGVSYNFASFTRKHISPEHFAYKERPVIYNGWEALTFHFDERKIHSLMKKAASLGAETFVLDDGWFGKRDDDNSSLGDWFVNKKKLPHGLEGLAKYAKRLGMSFGIWMEPEMVSEDSELYKKHPDWALVDPQMKPLKGRNQLVLDLRKGEVQDYLIAEVSKILSIPGISYLKWDYNRPLGDIPEVIGTCHFDYMRGLYRVLKEIRRRFPKTLMENCASGGNRFDHGMLAYFDQSWLSDCTDSFERVRLERSASYLFPQSVFSNHVSSKTNMQTMRLTSLDNKFDVAAIGALGYELDLRDLSPIEEKAVKRQIAFYKKHRHLFMFGSFYRLSSLLDGAPYERWQVGEGKEAIIVDCYGLDDLDGRLERLYGRYFDEESLYKVTNRPEDISFLKFGPLVNYFSPVHLKEGGTLVNALARRKAMPIESFEAINSGHLLNAEGLPLPDRWKGTGLAGGSAFIGDFGTRMYVLSSIEAKEKQ